MISDYALKLMFVAVIGGVMFYSLEKKKVTKQGLDKPLKLNTEIPKRPKVVGKKTKPIAKLNAMLEHSSEFLHVIQDD